MKKPGRYLAAPTLYLAVGETGSKSWIQRIVVNGRRHDMGLGPFSIVPLREAREKAHDNRKAAYDGRDLMAERKQGKVPTFKEATERTFEANRSRWTNEKHTKNWIQAVAKYAIPILGDRPVDQIDRQDVLRILTPIWKTKPERARRLRQRVRLIFSWSMANGFRNDNPADESISAALPIQRGRREPFRALHYSDVPGALKTIQASGCSKAARAALRFLILTASRSGEARGARWDEINPEKRSWTLPASRMKSRAEHRVPLSDQSMDVLDGVKGLNGGFGVVFQSALRKGRVLSDKTLMDVLRDTGLSEKTTVHGFRSAFRDWAAECTSADHATMEMSLSHSVGSAVERSYARSTLFEKRRVLMEEWGEFVG